MARRRFCRALMPPSDDRRQASDEVEEDKDTDSERTSWQLPPSVFADKGNGKSSSESSSDDDESAETSKEKPIWTEEDVINILRAMIDFTERIEKDPVANIKEFWQFMGMWISFPVTKSQLLSKIRALRVDYEINLSNNLFSTPFEAEVFKWSRLIWGEIHGEEKGYTPDQQGPKGESADQQGPKGESPDLQGPKGESPDQQGPKGESPDLQGPKGESPDQQGPKRERPDCSVLLHEMVKTCQKAQLGLGERYLRARIAKVEETKVNVLEERWKKQKLEEASISARKAALEYDTLRAFMRCKVLFL